MYNKYSDHIHFPKVFCSLCSFVPQHIRCVLLYIQYRHTTPTTFSFSRRLLSSSFSVVLHPTSAPHKLKSATLVYIGPIVAVVLCFWAFPVFLLFSLRVGVPARYQSSFDQVIDRYRYRGPNCSPVVPLLAACRLCPVASGASLLVIVLLIHDSRQFRVSFLFSFFSLFLVAFS